MEPSLTQNVLLQGGAQPTKSSVVDVVVVTVAVSSVVKEEETKMA